MILKTLSILAAAGFIATAAVSSADAAQQRSAPAVAQQAEYGSVDSWLAANGAEAIRLQHGGAAHNTHSDNNGGSRGGRR